MSLDPTTLSTLGVGGAAGTGVIWLALRALFTKQEAMKQELDDFKLKCAEKYVTSEAMKDMEGRIEKRFDKLESMLMNGHRE
jgi:hypothetical protein